MFSKIKWGIHPKYKKAMTSAKAIEQKGLPQKVIIPLRQHIGSPCVPLVKKGDIVKKGQLIAEAGPGLSSNIHASICGNVSAILNKPHPIFGVCQAIIIESDGTDDWADGVIVERDWQKLSAAEIIEIIKNAGIVGMGGAAFPSHVKLLPPPDKKIDTLLINAAECEPFLTVDHRVMLEYSDRVAVGVQIIKKVLGVNSVIIGIEDNKMDAVEVMKKVFPSDVAIVKTVPTRYPQGAEKILIKTLTGREVLPGKLPMDFGVAVQNVSTAVAMYDAVQKGIPLIERVVTVSGSAIKHPANLLLRIGTTFTDAINICGGYEGIPQRIVMGGPMMGIAQYTTDVPVIKGTSGILALKGKDAGYDKEIQCIKCGRCVSACPMKLNPGMLSILGEHDFVDESKNEFHLFDCIECGCCSFVCPARRNIVHYIKYSKRLAAEQAAVKKESSK